MVQCLKLGPGEAREVTSEMFDPASQRDIRQAPWRLCGGVARSS